jgi:PTH2 family peptidyl-tRNA hydrolase
MYKTILLIRKDLNMTHGKVISQCCHAITYSLQNSNKQNIYNWQCNGQKIISLKIYDFNTMNYIYKHCINNNIFSHIVYDKGLTQTKPNTPTVCIIGPDLESKINLFTNQFKLY